MYRKYIKRFLGILCSLLAMTVFSWLYIIIAILVRMNLGSPVIFKQQRPGLHEKIFTLYKFRTMTDRRDGAGELLPDSERLTKFGKFLRSTSLDELPEAINILKGDMSVVGPRPLLVQYLPFYNEEERHRHDVRPGLTGLSQVKGRNLLGWNNRFETDVAYVEELSFKLDLKVIFMTIVKVVQRDGILAGNQKMMQDLNIERGTSMYGDI